MGPPPACAFASLVLNTGGLHDYSLGLEHATASNGPLSQIVTTKNYPVELGAMRIQERLAASVLVYQYTSRNPALHTY